MKISKTAIVYPGVKLGKDCTVEDFCIIGAPTRDSSGTLETIIGDNAYLRSFTVIYEGNTIGNNFTTGNKVNIRECNSIGDNVSIGTLAVVEHHVKIENDVRIHSQAFIPEFSDLKRGSWVGPHAVLTNAKYPREQDTKKQLKGPTLEPNARVGANSTILPGVVLGEGCLVGAGATVSANVDPGSIVVGNPARDLKKSETKKR